MASAFTVYQQQLPFLRPSPSSAFNVSIWPSTQRSHTRTLGALQHFKTPHESSADHQGRAHLIADVTGVLLTKWVYHATAVDIVIQSFQDLTTRIAVYCCCTTLSAPPLEQQCMLATIWCPFPLLSLPAFVVGCCELRYDIVSNVARLSDVACMGKTVCVVLYQLSVLKCAQQEVCCLCHRVKS